MLKLFRFKWNVKRSGKIEGLFIAEKDQVENLIGQHVNFGEALGKHSEVDGKVGEYDIVEIELPDNVIKTLYEKLGRTISGYNPLDYIVYECYNCEYQFDDTSYGEYEDEKFICEDCKKCKE